MLTIRTNKIKTEFWYNNRMVVSFIFLFTSINPIWTAPETDVVRAELAPYLQEGEKLSHAASGTARFNEVIGILRRTSIPIRQYLDQCDSLAWQELPFATPLTLPQTPLNIHVGSTQTNYLFGSLRYYLALRLVHARLFDEARNVLQELTPENSIDPAGVLITKAIVFHHFSEQEEGLAVLKQFQEITEQESIPRRYTELAKLLQFDWEKKSMEEAPEKIARQMDDVRRRLGKGRTDDNTQKAEEDTLKSLEKLIEKLEKKKKKQKQQGDGTQANNPAEDSYRLKQKGPGNVDRREFSPGDNWGDLPPKERDEALLKIEREFPAYYRDIIEQYFREMAK
jgi:GTPase SAR1 family protein